MIQNNVSLKPYCNYRIGGTSRFFLDVKTPEELIDGMGEWRSFAGESQPFILGAGCNILIDDREYDGLVIRNRIGFIERLQDTVVRVGAGLQVSELLHYCVENSLSGLEWAGGLPGTVGGAVVCHAGAFGGEIKDSILTVESLDLQTLQSRTRHAGECDFSYRESIFKRNRLHECIVAATFQLKPGNREAITRCIAEKIAYRNERHPMKYPNIGSIFKNVDLRQVPAEIVERLADTIKTDPFPLMPTAALLSEAGLKGTRRGDIEISCQHPNFFVNLGSGTASDVRYLIHLAQETVKSQFNVAIEPEIVELRR